MKGPHPPLIKYNLHNSTWERLFMWGLPPVAGVIFVVTELAEDGVSAGPFVGGFALAVVLGGLTWLYFWGTHWLKLREEHCDVKFYRSGYYIPYAGVESLDLEADAEIAVKYRVRLWDGTFTSYTLPAFFRPAEPATVFYEMQRRVEAAKADRQRIASE